MPKTNTETLSKVDYGSTQYRNQKSKRIKCLIKKCHELHKLCGLKTQLLIYCPFTNKLQNYSSCPEYPIVEPVDES